MLAALTIKLLEPVTGTTLISVLERQDLVREELY